MTPADFIIVFLVLVSTAAGVWRGFTTEALSLITLLAAVFLAWTFAGRVEPVFGDWASGTEVRLWAARLVLFVLVLVIGGVVSWLARKLVRGTGLTGLDRTLGAVFGLLRAVVVVGLAVLVLEFFALEQEPWWQEARLRPYAERAATALKYYAELGTRYLQEQPVVQSARIRSACVVALSG